MLRMATDKVSNVRVTLAKTMRRHFKEVVDGAFIFDIDVNDAIRILKTD